MKHLFQIEEEDNHEILISEIGFVKKTKREILVFKKFYQDVSTEKEKIDNLENDHEWDRLKKIGNPYELIYTSHHKKRKRESISNYQPISRSYFKMWEIYCHFSSKIFQHISIHHPIVFAHLAEGPGGFMEASYNYRKYMLRNQIPQDTYCGITLPPNNDTIPDWNKLKKIFGESSKQIKIHYGNLYILNDVLSYIKHFKKRKPLVVTADGGFDYSSDFNGQEINSCQIIYSECVIALHILETNGTFVCKVFDLFTSPMIKILYLLYKNFREVYIYKPETSRPANSEKYLVCIGFKNILTEDEKQHLLYLIYSYQDYVHKRLLSEDETLDLTGIRVPNYFCRQLIEFNHEYVEQQKFYLNRTLSLGNRIIPKDEYDELLRNQVRIAVEWCQRYHIPINQLSGYLRLL
jgi:23S rRNA U2552 (ribose-2'-O)-methylase RlmE/FtsJ